MPLHEDYFVGPIAPLFDKRLGDDELRLLMTYAWLMQTRGTLAPALEIAQLLNLPPARISAIGARFVADGFLDVLRPLKVSVDPIVFNGRSRR